MSIRRNIAVSFGGQIFQVAIRLFMTPIYLALMGPEGYGLVGIYILFIGVIQLFNLGLNASMLREIARMRGGATSSVLVRRRLIHLALVLSIIAGIFVVIAIVTAPIIATRWLKDVTLPLDETVACLRLLSLAAAISFVTNLFSAGLLGLDEQIRMNALGVTTATLRFVGVFVVLRFISARPIAFSAFQVAAASIEIIVTIAIFYRYLSTAEPKSVPVEEASSGGFHRFAAGLAFLDIVWAAILQADRIVLSKALPLADFAFFTITVTAASGVMLIIGPIVQALQPRFAALAAAGKTDDLRALYFKASHGVAALSFSAGGVLAVFPRELIYSWTNNPAAAEWAARVLPLYAIGNACACVGTLPFLLQFALGKLRLHIIGHAILAVIYFPAVIILGLAWGGFGTGLVWFLANLVFLVIWVPLVHAQLLPAMHRRWLLTQILPPVMSALVVVFLEQLVPFPANRLGGGITLMAFGCVTLGVSVLTSGVYRHEIFARIAAVLQRGSTQ